MKRLFCLAVAILMTLITLSCEMGGGKECRIYLEEDYPNYFTALYVVESPQGSNGNWGANILNNYEILEGYGWKMYRFDPGEYDIRVEWDIPQGYTGSTSFEDTGQLILDGHGIRYSCDPDGDLFITSFWFD